MTQNKKCKEKNLTILLVTLYNPKMAMTGNERVENYRAKMYEAGYKQKIVWVPMYSEGKKEKLERRMFLSRLEALTAGWSKTKLSNFFSRVLKLVKEMINEEGG